MLSFGSKIHNSVSPVEGSSDLLIGLNKSLQLNIQIFVLALEDIAVGLDSIDLSLEVAVSLHQVVIRESKVVLLFSGNHKLVVSVSKSIFSLEHLGSKVSISGVFTLGLSLEVSLFGELPVEVSLEGLGLDHKSGVVVLGSHELGLGVLESLVSSSKLEVLGVGELGELVGLLLSFIEVVVNALELGVIILAFSLLESDGVSQSIDLILIFSLLLSELSQLVLLIVSILSQTVSLIRLNGNFSLEGDALLLSSADLISN